VPFTTLHYQDPPAISIVLAAEMPNDTDLRCDSTSNRSFRDAVGLFGKQLHVIFPELTSDTPARQTYTYLNDECLDKDPKFLNHAIAVRLLQDIRTITVYLQVRSSERLKLAQAALSDLRSAVTRSSGFRQDVVDEINKFELPPASPAGAPSGEEKEHSMSAQRLPKLTGDLQIQSAGAGDCRGAQLSVTTTPP
jgi:hypothetical protein